MNTCTYCGHPITNEYAFEVSATHGYMVSDEVFRRESPPKKFTYHSGCWLVVVLPAMKEAK